MFDRFAVLAATAVCLLAPGVVLADDDDFSRKGVYGSAGALLAIENFGGESNGSNLAGGFDFRLGYRASDIVSIETEFEWAGIWHFEGEPPDDDTDLDLYTWSVNLKGNVPLGRIQPYGLIGFGFHRVHAARGVDSFPPGQSNVGGMMKAAAGVDFYVTRHVVLSPEFAYSVLFNGMDGYDFMGFGLSATYRF